MGFHKGTLVLQGPLDMVQINSLQIKGCLYLRGLIRQKQMPTLRGAFCSPSLHEVSSQSRGL